MRITENDIRMMVSESVRRVVKEAHGYIAPDGNGMTGGRWGSSKDFTEIEFDPRRYIEDVDMPEEVYYAVSDGLDESYSASLTIESEYDETTGYGSQYEPVNEISDFEIDDKFYSDVNALQIDESLKEMIINAVKDGIQNYNFEN